MVRQTSRRSRASAVVLASVLTILPAGLGLGAANAAEPATTLHVAPDGSGTLCTAVAACSLEEAQRQVQRLAPEMSTDITVALEGGTYRLAQPLRFGAADSGSNGHTISWVAAPGATPVFSGGARISGWKPVSGSTTVWQAKVPGNVRIDPSQLYVDGTVATRARTQLSRSDISVTANGIDLKSPALSYLNDIQQQDRVTMEFVNSFTDRFSPVVSIAGNHLTMVQPAWDNNTWGWDTIQSPFRSGPVYIENAREFLDQPGEWYYDKDASTVYYQPLAGQSMHGIDVEMPRLESLLQVGGTYDAPAHNLTFSGIQFSDTAWTAPDSEQGYADQQTGAFLSGSSALRPADAFTSCRRGCSGFEGERNTWHQAPAAVQVSAADDIALTDNLYTNLGSVSLGIGQDANANGSGVGLGASNITVSRSRFFESAGGGIVVGGIQPDAHHPSDPRMTNQDITITDNLVHDVAKVYQDQDGILFTYVTRATVTHNEVWNLPYSGISAGWGWGTNDVGGNAEYVKRGLYNYQPMYDTPTTFRDAVVSHNFVHDVVQTMNDAGAFYNLSKSPGSVLEENYLLAPNAMGTYFDEGSGLWTSLRNVYHVRAPGNTYNAGAGNITYTDNWLVGSNASSFNGPTNTVSGTVLLGANQVLPLDAARVVYDSGISQGLRTSLDPQRPAMSVSLSSTPGQAGGPATVDATLTNLDATAPLENVSAALTAPDGWSVTPAGGAPTSVNPGGNATERFTVTPPQNTGKLIDTASITSSVTYLLHGQTGTAVSAPITLSAATSPVISLSTFGSVPSVFAEKDGVFAIGNAGADIWGAGGQSDDDYGTIFAPGAFHDGSVMTVHVDSEDVANAWTKAGLVVRDDLTKPRQSGGYLALVVTPSNGITYNYDSNGDGLLDRSWQVRNVKAPVWLRLARTGTSVSAAYSTDGTTWTAVGSPVTLTTPQAQQDGGMIYTSHDRNTFGTAVFSGFGLN